MQVSDVKPIKLSEASSMEIVESPKVAIIEENCWNDWNCQLKWKVMWNVTKVQFVTRSVLSWTPLYKQLETEKWKSPFK